MHARQLGRLTGLVILLVVGCSENFGPPPPDTSRRWGVRAESFVGPVSGRTALSLVATATGLHLGTDRGLYAVDAADGSFAPAHGGFTDGQGRESVGAVHRMASDPTGQRLILVSRFGGGDFLTVSTDGVRSFRSLPLPSPNPLLELVDALYAFPPSDDLPSGAFAVAQGATLYRSAEASWEVAELPSAPLRFGVGFADGDGTILLAVETPEGGAVWESSDGGRSFQPIELRDSPYEILALARFAGVWHRIDEGVWLFGDQSRHWGGYRLVQARLKVFADELHYALLGESLSDGGLSLAWGRGVPEQIDGIALAEDVVASTLTLTPAAAVLALPDGDLLFVGDAGSVERISFAGGEFEWGSIAVHTLTQRLYLGHRRTGEIVRGRADDPASMQPQGTPLFQSESRALLVGPPLNEAIFAGSFGVHFNDGSSVVWEERNRGQFSYLLENFSGPVKPRSLAVTEDGTLWLGAIQGDGPYRSEDGGQSWAPLHAGLGVPGSRPGEDGLPHATSINAFAFLDDAVWMASFRGGAWRLKAGSPPVWQPMNRGLPDLEGASVDSCCFDTTRREVDVRDLVVTAEGTLLAATPWGAYRRPRGARSWEFSSAGLANADLRALAVDPSRPERVVAVARGDADLPAWLFLSRDAGLSWITVGSSLVAKAGTDVVWSRSQRDEIVALLENQGAWRVELDP